MSVVVMHNVVSVDGYIADHNDEVGPLFDWYFNVTTRSRRARWTSRLHRASSLYATLDGYVK